VSVQAFLKQHSFGMIFQKMHAKRAYFTASFRWIASSVKDIEPLQGCKIVVSIQAKRPIYI
jgi:hypothetical protein